MSIESWKKEYFQEDIRESASDLELVAYSLLKWDGALPENCAKHHVTYKYHAIFNAHGTEAMDFNGESCVLCNRYENHGSCANCPIVRITTQKCHSVYDNSENNPQPMIGLLIRVLVAIAKEEEAQ